MIDPRLIRPEAIAPTTDIVTPSPQYYGEGRVIGGQVQLGDVYGQLPSQSQEEYLYGSLASMAQSAMSIVKFPAQMEEAEQQRNNKHDQDRLFEYRAAQAELQQAQLNGKGTFEWGGMQNDISNPELFSSLELQMQESMLGNMRTKAGIAQAAEIKTSSLESRNRSVDARISELMTEYETELAKFDEKYLLYNPKEYYVAYQSNPKLRSIIDQVASYRDTSSTQMESAIRRLVDVDTKMARESTSFLVEEGTRQVIDSTTAMVNTLPEMISFLDQPNGPVAVKDWIGGMQNAEDLFLKIGLSKNSIDEWEIQSGSLLDRISNIKDPKDIRTLVETVVSHSLQDDPIFANDIERDSFASRIAASYDQNIRAISTTFFEQRMNASANERFIGLSSSRDEYIRGNRTRVPEVFAGIDPKEAMAITIGGLQNPNNTRTGIARRDFVSQDARDFVSSNMGTKDIPLNAREQGIARRHLNVNNLINTGLYEERDGKIYLSKAGEREAANQANALAREVFNDPSYLNLLKDELNSIEFDAKYIGQPSIESLKTVLNKDLLTFIKTHLPVGMASDKDLLIAMTLEDKPEGYNFPASLSVWMDTPASKMFIDVASGILRRFSERSGKEVEEALKIPNHFKLFNDSDRDKVLSDDSIEALSVASEFNRKMTEAQTDEDKAAVIKEYASHPWMNPVIMQNIVAKARQLDEKSVIAEFAIRHLERGSLAPADANVEINPLDFSGKIPISNPTEFWTNPKYFSDGRFTKEGAKQFALWTTRMFSGPIVTENKRTEMQSWMDEVVNTESSNMSNEASPLRGIPLLMLAEVVSLADAYTSRGIAMQHLGSNRKYPREVSYLDPNTGEQVTVNLSYDPIVAKKTDMFMAIMGNPSEKTTKIQLLFARQLAWQLRGAARMGEGEVGLDRNAVLEFARNNSKAMAGLLTYGTSDGSGGNIPTVMFAGPVGRRGTNPFYPSNANEFVYTLNAQLNEGLHDDVVSGLATLGNIFAGTNPLAKIDDKNKSKTYRDVVLAGTMFMASQNSQMFLPIPERFAESYNSTITDTSFHIKEGDVLPLWGAENGRDIMSILSKMSDDYLSQEPWLSRNTYFGTDTTKDNPLEYQLIDSILKNYVRGLNANIPGSTVPMLQAILPTLLGLNQNGSLVLPKDSSTTGRLVKLNEYVAFVDGFNNIGGYMPTDYNTYSGSRTGAKGKITLPPAYHSNGSPITFGFGGNITIKNSNGDVVPLFANQGNEVAAQFFMASPRTSKDPKAFSDARLQYVINDVIGLDNWNIMSSESKQKIEEFARADTNNIGFFRMAKKVAENSLPQYSLFAPPFDDFVYNQAGLSEEEFIRSWKQSGYYLQEDPRNSASRLKTNQKGHIIIGQNGRPSTRIPLSPDILKLIDPAMLGQEIISFVQNPPPPPSSPRAGEIGGAGDAARGAAPPDRNDTIDFIKRSRSSSQTSSAGPLSGAVQALSLAAIASLPPSNAIATEVIGSEGFSPSPKKVDRNGKFFTVGHGHLLDGSKRSRAAFKEAFPDKNYDDFMAGKGTLTKEEAFRLFEKDIPTYIERAKKFTDAYEGLKFEDHTEELQVQLISATYRGSWGLSPKARRLLSQGKYEAAANEFLNNKEYRDAATDSRITGIRARMEKVANAIRTEGERKKRLEEEKKKKEQAEKTK